MAIKRNSVNMGLDISPITQDKHLLGDLKRLYYALTALADALDNYTGILGAQPDEYATANMQYLRTQDISRLYRKATVAITAGQTVSIDAAGQFIVGVLGTVVGWAPANIAINAYGEIRLAGKCTSFAGLAPGTKYYAQAAPGTIGAGVTAQSIGMALDANTMFFNPHFN